MTDKAPGGMDVELNRLLGAPIEATEPYWMLHELWRRLPPSEALRVIAAAMQDIDAKDNALREAVRYMRGCSKLCADVVDDACCAHVATICEAALQPNAEDHARRSRRVDSVVGPDGG